MASPLRRWLRRFGAGPGGTWPGTPWAPLPDGPAVCNICHWSGEAFEGVAHSESATCPSCGAIARDRFLLLCLQRQVTEAPGLAVLETSPRLGDDYRSAMRSWFDYRCSDYDLSAHRADLKLDLQYLDLPDDSFDVVLSSHVLEHVPDTDRALDELYRIIKPGGQLLLMVPVPQGATAPPDEPEYHGDETEVFWRFGPDLTGPLATRGFDVRLLLTEELQSAVGQGGPLDGEPLYDEVDAVGVIRALTGRELTPVASAEAAERHLIRPSYMFLAWACRVPESD